MKGHCDDELLQLIIRDSSEGYAGEEVLEHLDHCRTCQDRLNRLAADESEWNELYGRLSDWRPATPFTKNDVDATAILETSVSPIEDERAVARQLLSPPSHPEMLGRIGRYEVERLIGTGGMGVVFKAFDTELNRPVAIKVLAPHLANNFAARQRFAREARAAAAVVHEHVVPIHNVETEGPTPFLVMQYVAGESLQQRIKRQGPLQLCEILRIGLQVAAGLHAAHQQGLVHRDIKPSNILLEETLERALITDFGLARGNDDATLTYTGCQLGTPQYMSPEQAAGENVDLRSDLFSLGSVLYAMSTASPPFRGDSALVVMRKIIDDQPAAIETINPSIPRWLCAIIDKLLVKSPVDRFQSADEVAVLLQECLAHVQQPQRVALPGRLRKLQIEASAYGVWQRVAVQGRSSRKVLRSKLMAVAALVGLICLSILILLETNTVQVQIDTEIDNIVVSSQHQPVAVVLVIHPDSMPNGQALGQRVASAMLRGLGTQDYFGLIVYTRDGERWLHDRQLERIDDDAKRQVRLAEVEQMFADDMPGLDRPLRMAMNAFESVNASRKHILVFTSGTMAQMDREAATELVNRNISLSAIQIDYLGIGSSATLNQLTTQTGGRLGYLLPNQISRITGFLADELESICTSDSEKLRHIGQAFKEYFQQVRQFPLTANQWNRYASKPQHTYSWRVAILPYLGHQALYDDYRFDEPWDSTHNLTLLTRMPDVYRSKHRRLDLPTGHTHFQGVATRVTSLKIHEDESPEDFVKRMTNTVLVLESSASVPWTKPEDNNQFDQPLYGDRWKVLYFNGTVGELSADQLRSEKEKS